MTSKKVAIVVGGRGAEAEVSRISGAEVEKALTTQGYQGDIVENDDRLWGRLSSGDYSVVFIALHGEFGEDGTVQGVCELLNLPYTGSGVLPSALCLDKVMAKRVMRAEKIATPSWVLLSRNQAIQGDVATARLLNAPMVVKPNRSGSSVGLAFVDDLVDLETACRQAAVYGDVLCEEKIIGTEITVGILGDDNPAALPTLEVISKRELYDYTAKYTAGASEHIIPARLPDDWNGAAQTVALRTHIALGCYGFSRVDEIVDRDGIPWVLEVNPIPGLTPLSLFPDAARAAGFSFESVCGRIVESALLRHAKRS